MAVCIQARSLTYVEESLLRHGAFTVPAFCIDDDVHRVVQVVGARQAHSARVAAPDVDEAITWLHMLSC